MQATEAQGSPPSWSHLVALEGVSQTLEDGRSLGAASFLCHTEGQPLDFGLALLQGRDEANNAEGLLCKLAGTRPSLQAGTQGTSGGSLPASPQDRRDFTLCLGTCTQQCGLLTASDFSLDCEEQQWAPGILTSGA